MALAALAVVLALLSGLVGACLAWGRGSAWASLARTLFKLLFCRGRRRPGVLTGLVFPIEVGDLTGAGGPELLTAMLRHGGRLPRGVAVRSVRCRGADIRDGVKGEKAVLEVGYEGETDLPTEFFVKFNLRRLSPMRLLVETTDVCRCEALFYHHLAARVAALVPTPRCYFVDYSAETGEFVLLSEVIHFGEGGVLPLKHRIRDAPVLEEQRLFVAAGARVNAAFRGAVDPELARIPRFDQTHREMWLVAQLTARLGLRHTLRRTLRGRAVNQAFMTWEPPPELLGREGELISDMPHILTSLCEDGGLLAFGHNDFTTDNAYFFRGTDGRLGFGAFDWQQSCLNNVGQEWAWNLHFLPPEFLEEHEAELLDLVLRTYAEHGLEVSRADFLNAYVLGTVQMFVWGGGGLQLLLSDLHGRGLLQSLVPDDPRCRSGEGLGAETLERLVGAEMTRRTFTNCCGIMRRHDFAGAWARWRERRGGAAHPGARASAGGGAASAAEAGSGAASAARARRRPGAAEAS